MLKLQLKQVKEIEGFYKRSFETLSKEQICNFFDIAIPERLQVEIE